MRRVFGFAVSLLVFVVLGASAASAAEFTNADCLGCHSEGSGGAFSIVDFQVGAVDYAACNSCHWVGDPGTAPHPYHNAGMSCGACHDGWGTVLPTAIPSVPTTAGWFFSAESRSVDATTLHTLHATPRWPAGADRANSRCASCHAAAACSACHTQPLPVSHGDHTYDAATGSRTATAWTGVNGQGTPVGNQAVLTAGTRQVTCSASACHAPQSLAPATEYEESAATLLGSWGRSYNAAFSGGSAAYTSSTGASGTIAGVTGTRFAVTAMVSPNGGLANILVDGSVVATVSCYASSTGAKVVYDGPLAAGTHVLGLVNTGVSGSGGGRLIGLDVIRVYSTSATAFVPRCGSCHPDRVGPHGYDTGKHTSTWQLAGCISAECHASRDLMTEHANRRPAFTCGGCHSATAPQAVKDAIAANQTGCDACHADFASHASAHVASSPDECLTCHLTANPVTLHAGSPLGGCAVCHANPTGGDLTAGKTDTGCLQCHDYSPFDPKHYSPTPHMSTEPSDCDGCHTRELLPEHVASAGFEPGTQCANCHAGAVWESLERPWNGQCDACHPTKHANADAKHVATFDHYCTAVCHKVSDVSLIHSRAETSTELGLLTGCRVCHVSGDTRPAGTRCFDCHGPLTDDHGTPGTIRGRVFDAIGRPLAGATIMLDRRPAGRSDRFGRYVIDPVTPGTHEVGVVIGRARRAVRIEVGFDEQIVLDLRFRPRAPASAR